MFSPLLLLSLVTLAAAARAEEPVQFNRDVRPILNAHCFKCHGGVKEAGGLNLQFREKALQAGETGEVAIVPGHPEKSAFVERIKTTDKEDRMPRKGDSLSPQEIALLTRWIAEGAKWENHWAYIPPQRSGKSIDQTVTGHLAAKQLTLAPEADVATLARRMSLDLIGLPPAPPRVAALQLAAKGDAAGAWRAYVDELLAAPAYGERWAVPWLDLARYADSRGYEKDGLRDMWRYRDWVIDALNEDKPYDRFVVEQLAGDLLPQASEEQVIATAFHRNTLQNDEGGTDDEEFRTLAVIDRVSTTFDALQGTSIGCVQCHGHPYDAFVHREYYELYAFLNNTADADRGDGSPTRKFFARLDTAKAAPLKKRSDELQAKIAAQQNLPANQKAFQDWLVKAAKTSQTGPRAGTPLTGVTVTSTAGAYRAEEGGHIILEGAVPARTTITVKAAAPAQPITSLSLEALPDQRIAGHGPGGAGGNFILTQLRAFVVNGATETPLEFAGATASFEQGGWPIAEALKNGGGSLNQGESGWAISGGTGSAQVATFLLKAPVTLPPGAQLRVVLECENEQWAQHVLASFRLSTGGATKVDAAPAIVAVPLAPLPKEVSDQLAKDQKKWRKEDRAIVERYFFGQLDPSLPPMFLELDAQLAQLAKMPACDLPIMQELDGAVARKTQIFERGNWMVKGAEVQPKTPQILNAWHDDYPRNRLGFAQWLTNGENPLTARVQVNRVWEQLFGVGLVETLEDFGSQGDRPMYQELLDDLAVRFQTEMKWSQKALLREIMLSRVYRQSSKTSKALTERDPANRLLARGARFRLSNEQIHDQALAIGGILSRKMAGPSVMPYQPPGIWMTPYDGAQWKTSAGEDSRRRSIYTLIRRSATYPSMVTFDAPNRETCVVRRIRTNTPLQSLDLMNSPVYMEAAEGLAKRMAEAGGTLEEQLQRGLSLALLRPARPAEVEVLRALHAQVGGSLKLVANAILNLDEVLTRN